MPVRMCAMYDVRSVIYDVCEKHNHHHPSCMPCPLPRTPHTQDSLSCTLHVLRALAAASDSAFHRICHGAPTSLPTMGVKGLQLGVIMSVNFIPLAVMLDSAGQHAEACMAWRAGGCSIQAAGWWVRAAGLEAHQPLAGQMETACTVMIASVYRLHVLPAAMKPARTNELVSSTPCITAAEAAAQPVPSTVAAGATSQPPVPQQAAHHNTQVAAPGLLQGLPAALYTLGSVPLRKTGALHSSGS